MAYSSLSTNQHQTTALSRPSSVNHYTNGLDGNLATSRDIVLSMTSRETPRQAGMMTSQQYRPSSSQQGGHDMMSPAVSDVTSVKREPWMAYSVLPGVSGGAVSDINGMTSQRITSSAATSVIGAPVRNALSPLSLNEFLPDAGSLFSSPRASARGRKGTKRAMSTSTLSSEITDIIFSIINGPATALPTAGSIGSSQNVSPLPGQPHGAWGHNSARIGSGGYTRCLGIPMTPSNRDNKVRQQFA